jgi:hypothetical protein
MKKILLSVYLLIASVLVASAQITITQEVVNIYGSANTEQSKSALIKNLSTDSTDTEYTWRFLSFTKSMAWSVSLCDPYQCYNDVNAGTTYDFNLAIGATSIMRGDYYFNDVNGQGSMTVVVTSKKNPSNADTVTFNATAWVTSVKEVNKAAKIAVYPNPAKNNLYFSTKEVDANSVVKIYDLTGKEVLMVNLKGRMENEVDCSGLSNGIYLAKFTVNGNTAVQRIVINR